MTYVSADVSDHVGDRARMRSRDLHGRATRCYRCGHKRVLLTSGHHTHPLPPLHARTQTHRHMYDVVNTTVTNVQDKNIEGQVDLSSDKSCT